jgi:pimeloyl-ACP methyl ester carboxylesterase
MPVPPGLHALEDDDPDGPLVVLVHGALDRAASFSRVHALLDDCRVLAYDRRGYNRSRHADPAAVGIEGHVDDLLALIDGRPAVVAGHSYGGNVALAAACRPGSTLQAVVAYEAPTPWRPEWPTDTAGSAAMRAAEGEGGPEAVGEWFLRRMIGDEGWARLPERTKADRRAEGETLLAELRSIRERAPFDPAAVPVPVIAAHGSESHAHQCVAAEQLAADVPDGELVVLEGARHGAHLSHPREFADLVRRALARAEVR